MIQNILKSITMIFTLILASCQENQIGTVDLTYDNLADTVTTYVYSHPCAMYNSDDFTRVKAEIATGTGYAYEEFVNLRDNSAYSKLTYTATPQTQIVRGDYTGTEYTYENYSYAMKDAAAAYQQALLWRLTGDDDYAANAVKILNEWAGTCTAVTSNDANHFLAAGCQGYTFANAGELLRDYSGWSSGDFQTFKTWMVDVFASSNIEFLTYHSNTTDTHYWANWDLVNLCSYMAIGILTEDDEMVDYVKNYFYDGVGNGALPQLVIDTFKDPLGTGDSIAQSQESGRDQGHATMDISVLSQLCQMAYTLYLINPSVSKLDFYAADNNAVLKLAEYTALFNLKDGTDTSNANGSYLINVSSMPFTTYTDYQANVETQASESSRGTIRPGWETIYMHYAKIEEVSSTYYIYSKKFADKLRPEGGSGDSRYGSNSGAFDQLGWGTLMMYR